ncbi:MAG: hypothetical protein B6I24_00050 [Bacteroidetes bacterium 4572_128]|nr:MAG: hypothetical protein B6I24_00050 [Bacteroidetes bacterium 4572_128]
MKIKILFINFFFAFIFSYGQNDNPIMVINTQGHTGMIRNLSFTPDGSSLISISEDKTIRFWNMQTGFLERTLRGQLGDGVDGMLYSSAISNDGLYFAISGYPSTYGIRTFNLRTGEQTKTLKGNTDVINDLCFSPNGSFLASACSDNIVRIWRLDEEGLLKEKSDIVLQGHYAPVYSVAFSPDNKKLVSASFDNTLRLWELDENDNFILIAIMVEHFAEARKVIFSPDGKYIFSGGFDGRVLMWDNEGNFIKEITAMGIRVQTLSVSPDATKLLVHGSQGMLGSIFEIPSGDLVSTFKKHNNTVLTSIFYNNDIAITAGGNDKDIYIWNIHNGNVLKHIKGKGKSVWSVAFSKKGLKLAFGNSNPTGFLKDCPLERSFDLKKFKIRDKKLKTKNFTLTKTMIGGKVIKHTDAYTIKNTEKEIIFNDREKDGLIRSYTLSKDGNIIVGSSFSLKKYNYNGDLLKEFKGHTGIIWSVSLSKNNKILASSSADQTIKLWNYKTGENLATFFFSSKNEWICLTPQGYYYTSEKGEKFIGWHVNRGVDHLAEFFPIEDFKNIYYKPDLVKKIILSGSFKKAVRSFSNEF